MYDDRLEILSPGRLPNTVTLDNMRETRYSRNPRIARNLVEFGWVRELNEGVKRIYTEMQRLLLNGPVFSEPDGTKVQLTLENNINTDKMYDNMVNRFRWGGIDKATKEHPLYLDENVRRMCNTIRLMFADLVDQLIVEGKNEKALTALDLIIEKIPGWQVTHDLTSVSFGQAYLELGEKEKGEALLSEIFETSASYLNWYKDLTPGQLRSIGNDYQKHLYIVHTINELSTVYGLPELQNKIASRFAIQE